MEEAEANIFFLAILGEQNEPIALRCFGEANDADMQSSAYAAIDLVQERVSFIHKNASGGSEDPFLGFICPTLVGEVFYKIYAYATATGLKIIAILTNKEIPNQYIRQLFEEVHVEITRVLCNPLATRNVANPKLYKTLDGIAEHFSVKASGL